MPSVRALQESVGTLSRTGNTTLSLSASVLTIGGQQYRTSTLSLNTAVVGAGGVDVAPTTPATYNVFAVVSGGSPALIASLSSAPSGFSTYKQLGRMIYGLNIGSVLGVVAVMSESAYQARLVAPFKNYIINGGFHLWQRTSSASMLGGTAYLTADRFGVGYNAGFTATPTSTRSTNVPPGSPSPYSLISGATTTGAPGNYVFRYRMEARDAMQAYQANPDHIVNLSFWMYTSAVGGSTNYTVGLYFANSVDNFTSISSFGGPPAWNGITAATWTKYTISFAMHSSAATNGLEIQWAINNLPASTLVNWYMADVMLTDSPVTPPVFSMAGLNEQAELAMCQRYYELGQLRISGTSSTGNFMGHTRPFNVPKRRTPANPDITTFLQSKNGNAINVDYTLSDIYGFTIYADITAGFSYMFWNGSYTCDVEL